MKQIIVLIIFFASGLMSSWIPGNKMYPANEIPEELLDNAEAVVRDYEEIFEIESVSKASRTVRYVVTILDENADEYAEFNEWYDKFRSLTDIKILIYDKDGEVIKKVKANEIDDYCSFSSFSIYEQNRQKLFSPKINSYPYTISIEYKQAYKGLFVYPVWQILPGYDISVEKSSFRIIAPEDHEFRYKATNLDIEPQVNQLSGKQDYYWEVKGVNAVESEDYSPYLHESTGILYTAPSDFSIDGYSGNMDTWDGLGMWAYSLIEGRDEITEATKADIAELVAESSDKRDIIRRIYKYMQSKTRYVSIQEGIGGWQPFPAIQVDEDGYGDCKALSNYTMALLKEAGIESFYTKVRAGSNAPEVLNDFVSNQSNHIILCVPMETDTIWLECTSQISPFGYIGNFTDDRHVLLVTPEGGRLVKTRTYTKEENTKVHRAEVSFKDEETSTIKVESTYRGLRYDIVSALLRKSATERERWVYNNTAVEKAKIVDFTLDQDPDSDVLPEINASLHLDVRNYGSTTGNRWFIPLNLLTRVGAGSIPERNRNRRTDIVYRSSFTDIDSISYELPEGYIIESAPAGTEIENIFGSYSVSIDIDKDKILYIRKRTMNKGRYPSSMYDEFRQFYIEIQKMDNCKLVLLKAES